MPLRAPQPSPTGGPVAVQPLDTPPDVQGPQAEQARQMLAEPQGAFEIVRDNSTGLYTGPLNTRTYLVPGRTPQEADQLLDDYLAASGQLTPEGERSTPASARTQDLLNLGLPVAGGTVGGIVGGIPGAAAGAGLGDIAAQGTEFMLAPEHTRDPTLLQRAERTGAHALEGGVGEGIGRVAAPLIHRAGSAVQRRMILGKKGPHITPREEEMFAPGGPFEEGATLTGVEAFPRPTTYGRGFFTNLDDYIAGALGARSRTIASQEQALTNLNAVSTRLVEQLAANPDPGTTSRILSQLLDTTGRGAWLTRKGLYQAADQHLAQTAPNVTADTSALTAFMNNPRIRPTLAKLEEDILARLEGRSATPLRKEGTVASTTEVLEGGGTARTAATTSTTATPRGTRAATTGRETLTTPTPPAELAPGVVRGSETTGTTSGTSTRTNLPLQGLLHTPNPDGTFTNSLPLGEAMHLRSAVRDYVRSIPSHVVPPAELTVARALERQLTTSINDGLTQAGPTARRLYMQAERYAGQMHRTLGNDTLVKLTTQLEDNPAQFYDLFIQPSGVDRINALRRAFQVTDTIPGSPLRGNQYFDQVVQPNLTAGLLRDVTTPATLENFGQALRGNRTLQEMIQRGELVQFQPGRLASLQKLLGDTTFEALAGGKQTADHLRRLDDALITMTQKQTNASARVAVLIAQSGGASSVATGTAKALQGQGLAGTLGMGAGAVLMFTPAILNRWLTNPAQFRRLVQGIQAPPGSPIATRLASQLASQVSGEYLRESFHRRRAGEPSSPQPVLSAPQ